MCEGMSSWNLTHQCVVVLFIYCMPICQAFLPNFWSRVLTLSWDSYTHQYMTEQAILNITMETLSKKMERQHDVDNEELVGIMQMNISTCCILLLNAIYSGNIF